MSCCICEASNRRALLCAQCFATSCAGRQSDKHALIEQRDAVREQLKAALADKLTYQRQQLELLRLSDELRDTQQRKAEVRRQLTLVEQRAEARRRDVRERQQALQEAEEELAAVARRAEARLAPQHAQQAQAVIRAMDALAREQRLKVVRRAMDILPLTLAPASRPATPAAGDGCTSATDTSTPPPGQGKDAAVICGLTLPDARMGPAELARLSRTLDSALGYVALLLDLLSRFLHLPVVHRAAFQGSTTRVWQPDSFFDMRATPPNDAVRLCWPDGGGGGGGAPAPGGLSTAAAQQAQRAEQQLLGALRMLQRSAGMLVYARLGPQAAARVPEDHAPFTWLAKLCRLLAAEPRMASLTGPASGGAGAGGTAGEARSLAASAVLGRGGADAGYLGASMLFQGGPSDDGGEDEWEHLPRAADGMLPPRPWESVDVEHWEQALFADHGGGSSNGALPLGGARMAAAAAWRRALNSWRGQLGAGGRAAGGGS